MASIWSTNTGNITNVLGDFDKYNKRCFVFYKNPVIEDIKTKADAESKEKYNNNYLNIKKNTTDKKISGLIKKSMEETRNNGKIIL